ncbi:Dehydrogenase/reductase SDR family member 4 [Halotydeus destructor]|nr:Dehydrogenase/reductase SDR family member 4 [Halotydeus destructor]
MQFDTSFRIESEKVASSSRNLIKQRSVISKRSPTKIQIKQHSKKMNALRLAGSRHLLSNLNLHANAIRQSSNDTLKRLSGKVALVTASTDGIGLAIARRLAQDGAAVVISSRKEENVIKTVQQLTEQGLNVHGTVCHVGKPADRKKLIEFALEKAGAIDYFVSNAAVNPSFGPVLETPEDAWDKIFEVNVKAAFLLTKDAVPHIEKRGGGSIVFVSSIGGYSPFPAIGAYSVSKTALLGLTKALASELASSNIRVNCVCPGVIRTKFSSALTGNEGAAEESLRQIPMRRFGEPDEISGIVSFLCSDDSSYMTGESVVVAGGMQSRL